MIYSSATPGRDPNAPPPPPQSGVLSQDDLDRYVKFTLDLQAGLFSQASAYLQIITAGGYAGAFALWSLVKDDLSVFASLWTGLMFGISLAAFIAWNVFNMIWMAQERLRTLAAMEGKPPMEILLAYEKAEKETLIRSRSIFLPMWRLQLPITIGPAAIGFSILLLNALAQLLTLP